MGCTISNAEETVADGAMPQRSKIVDYKSRLEHKLYLARENPEPLFDLSDCNLSNVPHGIYSLCKVFRKNTLFLQTNKLSSLSGGGDLDDLSNLEVLNIHSNCFSSLPLEIYQLINLRELYVNDNKIKFLPDSICELINLEVLDICNNKIKRLPEAIGDISALRILRLKGNPLERLPTSICRCSELTDLVLDNESLVFPPKEVVEEGHSAIMKYLADAHGETYKTPVRRRKDVTDGNNDWRNSDAALEEKLAELEKIKEKRHAERLALEQYNDMIQKQELEMHDAQKANKQKFLSDLLDEQKKIESDVLKLQHEKDVERAVLIESLLLAENKADSVVSQLLSLKENQEYVQNLLEQERLEEERLLSAMHLEYQSLRTKDVLSAMEGLIQEEFEHGEFMREYEIGRAATAQNVLQQEIESDITLSELLKVQGITQSNIVSRLQKDEELQRAAVGALLERGDARSWGLVQQVMLVEYQLAEITAIEMERRKLHVNEQLNDLADMRVNLSALLLDLLSQQGERRNQLLHTLNQMERDKESSDYFWLRQYQRLMDSRPEHISKSNRKLDPILANYLLSEEVIHCLPFLAKWIHSEVNLLELTEEDLHDAGVTLSRDREALLRAIGLYMEEKQVTDNKLGVPSTSQMEEPSAPIIVGAVAAQEYARSDSLQSAECVICMDAQCQVIFVPCGHMCCCASCAADPGVEDCPMCRGKIERKIRVMLP